MKTLLRCRSGLLLGFLLLSFGCKTPPAPPEVREAENLERLLWRAGASVFADLSYQHFKLALKEAKIDLARENAKFGWFRNYNAVKDKFKELLRLGTALLEEVRAQKSVQFRTIADRTAALRFRIERLQRMTDFFNENEDVRKNLSQAEIKLRETDLLIKKEKFDDAINPLRDSELYIRKAEEAVLKLLARYMDKDQLNKWRKWADDTITDSKTRGITVILVSKLERTLTIYRNGAAAASFDIGLGKFGLSDKLYSGDDATPEGKYRVIQKIPASPLYKALLINYPNEEDERMFAAAKKNGLVPPQTGIGGAIEIHGGGKDRLTKGCVGLENKDMDEVYRMAEVGTPVTIVGALSVENSILAEIKKFVEND